MPYFFLKLEKMSQNMSSVAVVIGALRVNIDNFNWGLIISKVGNQNAFFTWIYFGKNFDLRLPNGCI